MKDEEAKMGWNLKYISLLVFTAILSWIFGNVLPNYIFKPSAHPDYATLNRPYLEPSLFLQHTSTTNSQLHFEITNIGKLSATNIRFLYSTPSSKAVVLHPQRKMDLAFGGCMSVTEPLPLERLTNLQQSAAIQLQLLYSATIDKRDREFVSCFYYTIHMDTPTQSPVHYESASHEEGTISDEDAFKIFGLKAALDESTGTYAFWFKVPDPTFQPGLLFESESKALFYDPRTRTISLNRRGSNGVGRVWAYSLPNETDEWFHIAVSWSPEQTALYINGDGPGALEGQER